MRMLQYLPNNFTLNIIYFQAVVLVVILSNLVLLHRSRKHASPGNFPLVSILVPARNEENNIEKCVRSLLAQNYPSFEILVLDDQSSDGTNAILAQLAISQPALQVLSGIPPPEGQAGKNWACSQLAQQAQGDLLFFTDADTVHQPRTLGILVTALIGEQADLLTGFPRQQVVTWAERLLVPFFSWASLCFFPLWLAYRLHQSALVVAVGQMMLFRREAYQMVGGHASLGTEIVDDIQLARKIKVAGLRWRVTHISDLITCRMYHGSQEAVNGFSKNLFAAFDFRLLTYLFVFLWLGVVFLLPLITLAMIPFEQVPTELLMELMICIGLSLLLWLIPYWETKIPFYLGLLYPLTILANEWIAFRSLCFSLTGRLTWKDRPLARPKWKWL
jgi:chlorobactene glucosyltransferase